MINISYQSKTSGFKEIPSLLNRVSTVISSFFIYWRFFASRTEFPEPVMDSKNPCESVMSDLLFSLRLPIRSSSIVLSKPAFLSCECVVLSFNAFDHYPGKSIMNSTEFRELQRVNSTVSIHHVLHHVVTCDQAPHQPSTWNTPISGYNLSLPLWLWSRIRMFVS